MSNSEAPTGLTTDKAGTSAPAKVLHRVCIQCNNVFRVPPEKFDAKQCPNCHKG